MLLRTSVRFRGAKSGIGECLLLPFHLKDERREGWNAQHCLYGDGAEQDYTSAGCANKQVKKDLQAERGREYRKALEAKK